MNQEEQGKKLNQLIARCWADEAFKRRLLADPATTLKAEGVTLPDGLSIKALENTDRVLHLVIPVKPADFSVKDLDLSDEELANVVGGTATAGVVMPSDWLRMNKTLNVKLQ